jgi:SAM-dependent methyltransferase
MICRSCGGPTSPLLDLGNQPLANHLLDSPQDPYDVYPLKVMLCNRCHLGQLHDIIPPDKLFREYVYYTSVSGPSVESARKLVASVHVPTDGLVVEIGSNDGYLLQFYKQRGINVLGIDPAQGPANAAMRRGIPTLKDFFTEDFATHIPKADIIHVNNVLAHVPDLNDFVAGLAILLKRGGTCYIEVPYLLDLLRNCWFDSVYHEHVYYFSYQSLERLFARHKLAIVGAESISTHGGSLRLRIGNYPSTFAVAESNLSYFAQSHMDGLVANLMDALRFLRSNGKRVWGFGAAAKATVMMNRCGITSDLVEAVADDTPAKIGKYIPGTGIGIAATRDWIAAQPDYTCIFAWNYTPQIIEQYQGSYRGVFFTPYNLGSVRERVA